MASYPRTEHEEELTFAQKAVRDRLAKIVTAPSDNLFFTRGERQKRVIEKCEGNCMVYGAWLDKQVLHVLANRYRSHPTLGSFCGFQNRTENKSKAKFKTITQAIKISEKTQRFDVAMTSFSSEEIKFKLTSYIQCEVIKT